MRTPRPTDLPVRVYTEIIPTTPAEANALPVLPQAQTSVSAVDSHRQCARLYWYQHGRGIRTPPGEAQAAGTAVHADYESGALTHPSVQLAIRDGCLPAPGPGVEHEREFWRQLPSGVWVRGFMDVVTRTAGITGLLDLKTRKSAQQAIKYAMPPNVLWADQQIGIYTHVLFAEDDPPQERIPAGHVYLSRDPTQPAVRRVDIPHGGLDRATAALRWEKLAHDHAAAVPMVSRRLEQVPPTRSQCSAYGGCPFRAVCDAADSAAIFGGPVFNPPATATPGPSLADMLAGKGAALTAAAPAAPPPPPPSVPAPPPPPPPPAAAPASLSEIMLFSKIKGAQVPAVLERIGKGFVVRFKDAPEICGAGPTPEAACLAALAELQAAPAPAAPAPAAPAPAVQRPRGVDLTGIDLTPPPGEQPYGGKGRHPHWLKARLAVRDGAAAPPALTPEESAAIAAAVVGGSAAAGIPAPARADVVTYVPPPQIAAVPAPAPSVLAASAPAPSAIHNAALRWEAAVRVKKNADAAAAAALAAQSAAGATLEAAAAAFHTILDSVQAAE